MEDVRRFNFRVGTVFTKVKFIEQMAEHGFDDMNMHVTLLRVEEVDDFENIQRAASALVAQLARDPEYKGHPKVRSLIRALGLSELYDETSTSV